MGGRGSASGKYASLSVDYLQRKLTSAQQTLNKALQDRAVFGGLQNTAISKNLARRAKQNVTRANKTIDNAEAEIKALKAAIEKAKRRKRDIPF